MFSETEIGCISRIEPDYELNADSFTYPALAYLWESTTYCEIIGSTDFSTEEWDYIWIYEDVGVGGAIGIGIGIAGNYSDCGSGRPGWVWAYEWEWEWDYGIGN